MNEVLLRYGPGMRSGESVMDLNVGAQAGKECCVRLLQEEIGVYEIRKANICDNLGYPLQQRDARKCTYNDDGSVP